MVTYKWPSWLHQQTEKQRIIWAYKILFLDVLFPLSVNRIIFCDSDQIIRTDLVRSTLKHTFMITDVQCLNITVSDVLGCSHERWLAGLDRFIFDGVVQCQTK